MAHDTMPGGDTTPDAPNPASGCALPAHGHLVVTLECDRPLAGGLRLDLHGLEEVVIGRGAERNVERRVGSGRAGAVVRVPGPAMSATHARLVREGNEWIAHDLRSTNGMFVNGRAASLRRLRSGDVLELGRTLFAFFDGVVTPPETAAVEDSARSDCAAEGLTTLVPRFAQDLRLLPRVAASGLPVLVLGETGTGKEVLARAVHALSRRSGALVPVNCAALPGTLVESQLFGHCRGAFSGALRDSPGLVRAADRGTLLLDEIGDLPLPAQGALLRVLQESEVLPVGATRPIKVDVRVVAATHRDLKGMAQAGAFRADLLARLEGAVVRAPPLRERRADLGALVATLLRRIAGKRAEKLAFEPRAALALSLHAWPANVRELEQCLARAVATADERIGVEHLPAVVVEALSRRERVPSEAPPATTHLRDALASQLRANRGNVAAVARAFGKAPAQIHRWMRRFGVDPNEFRDLVEKDDADATGR